MVSYLGNLVFLSLGGQMMDRFDRKKTTMAVLLLWMAALVVYVVSDHFLLLWSACFSPWARPRCSTPRSTC